MSDCSEIRVSVISPLYNASKYVTTAIESLKSQDMSSFEVIFVDDCSTDNSVEVARAAIGDDSRFSILSTDRNSGPGVARNIGLDYAKGEYIAFIDSDDYYDPQFLSKLLTAADGCRDLAYCQLKYGGVKDGEIHHNPVVDSAFFTSSQKRAFLRKFVTFSVCFLFRRDFLNKNGLRFPSNRNSEDTNFLIRCLLLADSIACVDEPLYTYVVRESSLSTSVNPVKYRERMRSMNTLMKSFSEMKKDNRYISLRLGGYNGVMLLIWIKKGLMQCLKDKLETLIKR